MTVGFAGLVRTLVGDIGRVTAQTPRTSAKACDAVQTMLPYDAQSETEYWRMVALCHAHAPHILLFHQA
jgi:3-hydroxyisobutyrate dehydrogenase-like beta-hydroxyacid dehydrogenase